ncbi:MAG: undecaprenyl-phosphate glucose phosphotransferase [Chitinophagaceae bacterium]
MKGKYATFILFINIFFDLLAVNFALIFASISLLQSSTVHYVFIAKYYLFVIPVINILWLIAAQVANTYSTSILVYFKVGMANSVKAYGLFVLLLSSWTVFFLNRGIFDKYFLLKFFIVFGLLFFFARTVFYFLKKFYSFEFIDKRKVLVVGDESKIKPIKKIFDTKNEYGFIYSGNVDNSIIESSFEENYSLLKRRIQDENIHEIFFVKPKISNTNLYEIIRRLDSIGVRTKIIPDFFDFYRKPQRLTFLEDIPILSVRDEPLDGLLNRTIKRVFDVIFSVFVITFIFSWLFPILAFIIKISSRGPVFFKQLRPGKDGKPFVCYKFRSMKINETSNISQTEKNDPRITKIGSLMRKTSIDELPQFFNVLLGNMSIVGPRPQLLHHPDEYASMVEKYMIRHYVKPGITGWAQVHGFRGPVSSVEDMQRRVEMDVWYIENWSLVLDIQVILLTIYNQIRGEEKAY